MSCHCLFHAALCDTVCIASSTCCPVRLAKGTLDSLPNSKTKIYVDLWNCKLKP